MNGERKLFTLTRATDSDYGLIVVSIEGELDLSVADDLSAAIDAQTDTECSGVVLDMEGVTFIDSHGLAALLKSQKLAEQSNATLVLRSPSKQALELLKLTKLESHFTLA